MDIEIPRELADAEQVPEDLDANVVGPYMFPTPRRRRTAGIVYAVAGAFALIGALVGLPDGMYVVAGAFILLAVYHAWTATHVEVDEQQAFGIAGRNIDFPVGHASGAIRFEGIRSHPVWNILLYDAHDPPTKRALVQIDAVGGELRRDVYIEEV